MSIVWLRFGCVAIEVWKSGGRRAGDFEHFAMIQDSPEVFIELLFQHV